MIKLKTNKTFIKYQKKLEIKTIKTILKKNIYNKFELNNKINKKN
jgi:hypothetical protein